MKTFSFFTFLFSIQIFAAQEVGNPVDSVHPHQLAAWFTGQKDIQICVNIEPDFGVHPTEAQQALEEAFSEWNNYYFFKTRLVKQDGPHPSFRRTYSDDCSAADLVVYFGTLNAQIEKAKSKHSSPYAFVQKTAFDPSTLQSRGFLWVTKTGSHGNFIPNWQTPHLLKAILMHELGHVYGMEHIPGTIMDEHLSRYFEKHYSSSEDTSLIANIDQTRNLYWCFGCAYSYEGKLRESGKDLERIYELLVGRAPSGQVKSRLTYNGAENPNAGLPHRTLTLTDDEGSKTIGFAVYVAGTEYFSIGGRVFSMLSSLSQLTSMHSDAIIRHGVIKSAQNKMIPVEIIGNTQDFRIKMTIRDPDSSNYRTLEVLYFGGEKLN